MPRQGSLSASLLATCSDVCEVEFTSVVVSSEGDSSVAVSSVSVAPVPVSPVPLSPESMLSK